MTQPEIYTEKSDVQATTVYQTAAASRGEGVLSSRLELLVFVLVLVISGLSSYLGHRSNEIVLWLSNGLLFAIAVRRSRAIWTRIALLGLLADILASILFGETIATSIVASAANSVEIFLAAILLTHRYGAPLRLSRPRPLLGFLLVGVLLAPALACALSALWLRAVYGNPFWATYQTWFLGDALGMAIVAPLVYIVQEPDFFSIFQRRQLVGTLCVLTVPTVVSALVFTQVSEPLLFLISPALIFVVFYRGFPGAAMAVGIVSCISLPLTITGHGAMMLSAGTMAHKIVVLQIFLAVSLLTAFPIAALLEERTALERSLKEREIQLFNLANTDALTGQANRRAFDERLEAEWQCAAAARLPLALLSIDIDLFKSFNDIYGHPAGDDCLRHVATLAAQTIPPDSSARLYRLGGEEFAVIFPGADAAQAHALAEQIRQAVFSARIEHTGNPLGRQTVSIGIVTDTPMAGNQALCLLAQSDKALYLAKHNGRNRCEPG